MHDETNQAADYSPPVERWSKQRCFDILFKKFFIAYESERVSNEINSVLLQLMDVAITEAGIDYLHPMIRVSALSLMLDNLDDIRERNFYHGLVTVLSHGVDQSIFDEMDDKSFFGLLPDKKTSNQDYENKPSQNYVLGSNYGSDITLFDLHGFSRVASWLRNDLIVPSNLKNSIQSMSDALFEFMDVDSPEMYRDAIVKMLDEIKGRSGRFIVPDLSE